MTPPADTGRPPDAPPSRRPHALLLAFGVLGGPSAWASHLGVSYYLVPRACAEGTALALHLATVAAVGVTVAALVVAGRLRAGAGAGDAPVRALGTLGLLLGWLFLAATLAEGIPALFVAPCR